MYQFKEQTKAQQLAAMVKFHERHAAAYAQCGAHEKAKDAMRMAEQCRGAINAQKASCAS